MSVFLHLLPFFLMNSLATHAQNDQQQIGQFFDKAVFNNDQFIHSPISSSPTINGSAQEISKIIRHPTTKAKLPTARDPSQSPSPSGSIANTTVGSPTLLAKFIDAFKELEKYKSVQPVPYILGTTYYSNV
jgi:hypothetical protein